MTDHPAYHVADLTAADIDRAFPLVDAARAVTDFAEWRRLCEMMIAAEAGVLGPERMFVCANARGYLKGLCMVKLRLVATLRILDVPLYVIATTVDDHGVGAALDARIGLLARCLDVHEVGWPCTWTDAGD